MALVQTPGLFHVPATGSLNERYEVKVLALVTEAYGGRGGIALYDSDLINALCELEFCEKVTVIPRIVREDLPDELPDELDFRAEAADGLVSFLGQFARLLVTAHRYDLVVCAHVNLLPFAAALSRRSGTPLVLVIYGIEAWEPFARKASVERLGQVNTVITISDFTGRRFAEWSGFPAGNIKRLPNALRPEHYGVGPKPAELERKYGLAGCKVIMTLGRLSSQERYKGVDEVLDLMPRLLAQDARIRYLVAGEGDDRQRLEEKARRLGIADQVVFTGWMDEREKADHYRLADAFVMPGRGEGFGFVFLEAMACGIPVVASELDGSREAVRGGEIGSVVNPDDTDALFAAITNAIAAERKVPDGLSYFFYPRFRERLEAIIDSVRQRHGMAA